MDTTVIAPYLLRAYIWQVLKANTTMSETDYRDPLDTSNPGVVPIVPLAEAPEISQFDKPYIVYGYSEIPSNDFVAHGRGNMAFVIYSTNFRELSRLTNIITFAFNRADESARDVNAYTSTIPAFIGLRFGTIQVSYVEGGSPEESEGGRQSAAVNIRFEYFVDYDVKTQPIVDVTTIQGWERDPHYPILP